MEILQSYGQSELANREGIHRSRIKKDKDKYVPIKIITAQSRATARGYTVRYVKREDFEAYIKENKLTKRKSFHK